MHTLMDDGVRLADDREGDPAAPPILLLHGGGQSRHSWRGARHKLAAAGYYAIALDQRGHGDSDWSPDGDYRIDRFAADVRAVCAGLARPVVVVGASLGGLAAIIAVGEPPGVATHGVVLVDVAHRPDMQGAQRILGFMTDRRNGFASPDEAADAIAAYLPHRPRPSPESVLRSLRPSADGSWRWHWDPAFAKGGRANSLRFDTDRFVAAIRAITAPVLMVRGGSSEIVSQEIADEFRAILPAATYVDIPGAGHMVAGDDNDAFTGAVLDFLGQSTAAPRG